MKKNSNKIYDISQIRKQYRTGLTIRNLSFLYNIPYATLYRALKGKVDPPGRAVRTGRKK